MNLAFFRKQKTHNIVVGSFLRRKRDSLRASQKGILNKHRKPNSLQEFCIFYFPKKAQTSLAFLENKKPTTSLWVSFCGERGSTNCNLVDLTLPFKTSKPSMK